MTGKQAGVEALRGPEAERLVSAAVEADVGEALKERAMDEAPVGITITDPSLPDNPMVYVNEAYERLTGYSREAVIGRNCRLLQGPDTREEPVAEMARAVDEGEPVTVEVRNYRKDGSTFWNRVDIAPIREDGEVAYFVGFQTDVTRRVLAEEAARERAEQLRDERSALSRVLDRVDDLLAAVTDALVQARTRDALQRRVCQRVSDVYAYAFAWVGEYDPASESVAPVVGAAGDGTEIREFDLSFADDDPVTAAVRTGEVQVVADAAATGGLHGAAWPDRYRSMAAVPLSYRESTYGVLAVYATQPEAFDDHERAVLAALGRAVATGVNAVESHRRVAADERVELEFVLAGTDHVAVVAARESGCELTYVGAERSDPGALTLLFEVASDPGAVVDSVAGGSVVAERDDGALVAFSVSDPSLVSVLAERGVAVASITASPSAARLVVHVPEEADGRTVAEVVESRCSGAELVAYRRESSVSDRTASAGSELTDRQRAVLRRAHASGYFDTPRAISGEALAESMGVAPATFHEHLRAALRKVVDGVVDSEDLPTDRT